MRRDEYFPVDMPLRWTTRRYRAVARVRLGLLNFLEEVKGRLHSLLTGSARARAVRLFG